MVTETIDIHIQEKLTIFFWALGIGLLMLKVAWHQGLFKPFHTSPLPVIRGIDVLKGFALFLFIEILLIPAIASLIFSLNGENLKTIALTPTIKAWINFWIIVGGFVAVLLAYLELTPIQRRQLWRQTNLPWYHSIGVGIATWFVSYPLVLAFSQIISLLIWSLFHQPFIEQVAVQQVRQSLSNPFLFGLMAFAVVILVPLTEEFLFRGLLQSWLKHKLHQTTIAIVLSSFLFTGFHYSGTQGLANIELLSSLFLLSCVLGFIYERQRSLLAPVALHGFFNLMSLILIFQDPPNN